MIGRFISHEGKIKNTPNVRFGNISMMPEEPMTNKYNHPQETFLVDQRSIPGYSGSAVFVFIDPTLPRPPFWGTPLNAYRQGWHGPWLLGLDWAHIHNYEGLLTDKETEAPAEPKRWVRANTGMAGVIPAWRILQLLDREDLVEQRTKDDEKIKTDGD